MVRRSLSLWEKRNFKTPLSGRSLLKNPSRLAENPSRRQWHLSRERFNGKPISSMPLCARGILPLLRAASPGLFLFGRASTYNTILPEEMLSGGQRSEERRVGKGGSSSWLP